MTLYGLLNTVLLLLQGLGVLGLVAGLIMLVVAQDR